MSLTPEQKLLRAHELRQQAIALEDEAYSAMPSCARCMHHSQRICIKYQSKIPDDYHGADCTEYEYDLIPF